MKEIDLHGIRYADVQSLLDRGITDALNEGLQELRIVTGHSIEMRQAAQDVLNEYGFEYFVGGYLGTNPATITVYIK